MEQIRCIRKPTQICPDTCPLQIVEKVREALTDYPARNAVRRSSQRKLIRQ